jgi:hypothetical protein
MNPNIQYKPRLIVTHPLKRDNIKDHWEEHSGWNSRPNNKTQAASRENTIITEHPTQKYNPLLVLLGRTDTTSSLCVHFES